MEIKIIFEEGESLKAWDHQFDPNDVKCPICGTKMTINEACIDPAANFTLHCPNCSASTEVVASLYTKADQDYYGKYHFNEEA